VDPDRIRRIAVARGLLSAAEAAALDDQLAVGLIFRPGFSTSAAVTDLSGRGVGMDVVQERVRTLGGEVAVGGAPGVGARLTIRLPLTLTTSRAILLEQGGQLFALPSATVERDQRVRSRDLTSLEGRLAVVLQGQPIAAVELADVLERPPSTHAPADWRPFFILGAGGRRFAFLVDRLVGAQEIVVKRLGWPLKRVRNVAGATVLGSGETVVILEPADLVRSAARLVDGPRAAARAPSTVEERRHRILVVDDSLTTRSLERSILESRGYEVVVAVDGVDALERLRSQAIDLVVSDLEMPRMDGYALTAEIRRDERLRRLPVVLVTSLDSREHRERGVAVGADAYIVKSGFDQENLIETVARLL
jgi:two-component system, chemotaxis family, sensor kinase CheA